MAAVCDLRLSEEVHCVEFCRRLPSMLVYGSDGSVGVVQVEGDEGEELLLERLRVVVGDRVTCLAVSPRSTWGTLQVAFCAGPCALYWGSLDTSSEQGVLHLKDALRDSVALCRVFPALASPVLAMEIVADGDALSVACEDGSLLLWRTPEPGASPELIGMYMLDSAGVRIQDLPDQRQFAVFSRGGRLLLFSTEDVEEGGRGGQGEEQGEGKVLAREGEEERRGLALLECLQRGPVHKWSYPLEEVRDADISVLTGQVGLLFGDHEDQAAVAAPLWSEEEERTPGDGFFVVQQAGLLGAHTVRWSKTLARVSAVAGLQPFVLLREDDVVQELGLGNAACRVSCLSWCADRHLLAYAFHHTILVCRPPSHTVDASGPRKVAAHH